MTPDRSEWMTATAVFDQGRLLPDHAIRIEDGEVAQVAPTSDLRGATTACKVRGVLAPGFVDLQVNGGGGVLLNQSPTVEGIAKILAAHRGFGTVALMPTVITDRPEVMSEAAQAALDARGLPGMIGLHIEGPHISTARRGTHRTEFIRPFEPSTLKVVQQLRGAGMPVMITVAPEAITPAQVAELAATGAVVSIGHSDARAEDVQALLDAGADCFTHLFNAMSQMQGRAPGVVGAALGSGSAIGIICDGVHVCDDMVALAFRACRDDNRMFLVSDAMPTVGGPDEFTLYDMTIRVVDGALVNPEGSLAGAHTTMAEGVARLVGRIGLPLEKALNAAITAPARAIGRPHLASVLNRSFDDLVVVGDGGAVSKPLAMARTPDPR